MQSKSSVVTPCWVGILLPFLWWVGKLILLPHTGDTHVHVEPVHLLRPQVTEAKSIAGHVLYLVAVHYLLNDALEHTPTEMTVTDRKTVSPVNYQKSLIKEH
jgi:hypothetical protein